jgi:hypothetical protein
MKIMCGRTIFKSGASSILKRILPVTLALLAGSALYGQRISVATNLLGYANFGTINGEIGLGVSKHFSLYLQGKYNPFTYKENSADQFQNRQAALALGCRYWLWHTWSGWFLMGQAGYTNYNRGGLLKDETFEGNAYGITLGAGYALMLHKRLNIDFGAGIMGGFTNYKKYSCPKCGKLEERGKRIFVAPNNLLVQLSYMF